MDKIEKKIFFELEIIDDYPPYKLESLWGEEASLGEQAYLISNIPFFAKGVALGDLVKTHIKDGALFYQNTIKYSENSTIRLVSVNQTKEELFSLLEELRELGCSIESFDDLYAINIPRVVDIKGLLNYLDDGKNSGSIDIEYGIIKNLTQ